MFSLHSYYQQDLQCMNLLSLPWERLRGKRILVAGATGLIGTFLVDTLFYLNRTRGLGMSVYAVARDEDTARQRFEDIWEEPLFSFYPWDVTQPAEFPEKLDYVIHAACDTQPARILAHPVETMMANLIGTENLLEVTRECGAERFLFLSSGSVYGEPRQADDCVDEKYLGTLNCNTVRAAYAESKRAGETLVKSWRSEYGLDVVTVRLAHVYGATIRQDDTKPLTQMILNCARKEDIVLHGSGENEVSCCYVADAVSGLLFALLDGQNGAVYNIAGSSGKLRTLQDVAEFLAAKAGVKVHMDGPSREEKLANYLAKVANTKRPFEVPERQAKSRDVYYTEAVLDTHKLAELGWQRQINLADGLMRTVSTLQEGGLVEDLQEEEPQAAKPAGMRWASSREETREAANSLRARHSQQQAQRGSLFGLFRRKL